MITGSTAAGEGLQFHFQFQTEAQTPEGQKLYYDMVRFMKNLVGKFGCKKEKSWPCTFGMNAKGGMDDCEFEKYNLNSLIPLYPDAKDVAGFRVMIKADSGPGRNATSLLTKLQMLGFTLYPGVPNITSVTQETNQN